MSSEDEDPRFRIPRGSSDEEINSDLASGQRSPTSDGDDVDEEALARVTAAVTTRDLNIKQARHVDPCTTDEPSKTVGASSATAPSHPVMIDRILHTIRSSATNDKSQSTHELPKLQKKIDRLHTNKATNLSVPLPAPVSARLERAAAFEQTATLLTDKWTDTVIRNRRAETLTFPLNEPRPLERTIKDLNSGKKKLMADHEEEIADILKEAGVEKDKDITKSEENAIEDALTAGKISKEDVLRRHRELARVRSMIFHYDKKMRRIKKIKSRKYRKEMKKDRERLTGEDDGALDSEAEKEEILAAERRRIEERVTQRHKNTSKWVRRQLQRGEAKRDESTRAAIEDQLRIHEELKRRQAQEVGSGNGSSDDDDGVDGANDTDNEDQEISDLEKQLKDPNAGPKSKKGIMALKFMQAAEERKRKEALALLNEMKNDDSDGEDDEDDDEKIVARQVFSGTKMRKDGTAAIKKTTSRNHLTDGNDADNEGDEVNVGDRLLENEEGDSDRDAEHERRIRETYEADDAEKNGSNADKSQETFDHSNATGAMRESAKSTRSFTTRLDGRLAADDENPWLNGFTVNIGAVQQHSAKDELGKDDETRHNKNSGKKVSFKEPSDVVHVVEAQDSGLRQKTASHVAQLTELNESGTDNLDTDQSNSGRVTARANKKRKRKTTSASGQQSTPPSVQVQSEQRQIEKESAKEPEHQEAEHLPGKKKQRRKKKGTTKQSVMNKESHSNHCSKSDDRSDQEEPGSSSVVEEKPNEQKTGNPQTDKSGMEDEDAADLARMEEVAHAFAGVGGADLAEFEAAKAAEIEEDLPTAKSINAEILPGWGAWDGAGTTEKQREKRKQSPFVQAALEKFEQARANAVQSRSDRDMRNVILDQRRHETATKMTLASVPYPYQSREQWERELSRPLCRELSSNTAMRHGIKKKVDVRPGTLLEPIQTPIPSTRANTGGADSGTSMAEGKKSTPEAKGTPAAQHLGNRKGKSGVINLRKAKAKHRVDSRRGLMS